MAKLKNTYILFGCDTEEINNRISLLYGICKYEDNYLIVLTGTEKEVLYMYERLKSLDTNFLFESDSYSTIDNVLNTFYYLFSAHRPNLDNLQIIDYGQIHVVSSEYHLERIQFICSHAEITKNLNIDYIGSITPNETILRKRKKNEQLYKKNSESIIKQIHRLEKLKN